MRSKAERVIFSPVESSGTPGSTGSSVDSSLLDQYQVRLQTMIFLAFNQCPVNQELVIGMIKY